MNQFKTAVFLSASNPYVIIGHILKGDDLLYTMSKTDIVLLQTHTRTEALRRFEG